MKVTFGARDLIPVTLLVTKPPADPARASLGFGCVYVPTVNFGWLLYSRLLGFFPITPAANAPEVV